MKISKQILAAMLCSSALLLIDALAAETDLTRESQVKAGTSGGSESSELIDILEQSGYTVFAELLEITGVAEGLPKESFVTCFAPANEAFNPDTVEKIRKSPGDEEVAELLRYHFIEGRLDMATLMISRRVQTLNGKFLMFWISKGEVRVNNHSKIVAADLKTSEAIVHGVARLLRPDVTGAAP